MRFIEKYSKYLGLLQEQPEPQGDAAAPDPNATPPQPEVKTEIKQATVPPEGYVNLVRMIAKALVMDIPAGEIDTILSGEEVTKENAFQIQKGLEAILKDNEIKSDNPERLFNTNYKDFENSINENNFMQKYEKLLQIMKKMSPYIS